MRDKTVVCQQVAEGASDGFGDPDAGGDLDCRGAETVVGDPEAGSRRSEVAAVVAGTRDAESLSKAPGAGGELQNIARVVQGCTASAGHLLQAREGFESAKENTAGFAFRLTGNVEAIVVTVDEIDVSETRRAEKNGIPRGATC